MNIAGWNFTYTRAELAKMIGITCSALTNRLNRFKAGKMSMERLFYGGSLHPTSKREKVEEKEESHVEKFIYAKERVMTSYLKNLYLEDL